MAKLILKSNRPSNAKIAADVALFSLKNLDNLPARENEFRKNYRACEAHRNEVLARHHGQVVECDATLADIGGPGKLNLLVAIRVNGVMIDHLFVTNELINDAGAKLHGLFKFKARVYGYKRAKGGRVGYSVMPTYMELDPSRGQF